MSVEFVQELPVDRVHPDPTQPRKTFDPEEERRLAETVETDGVQQPIRVRTRPDGDWEIIFGERRWRAAKLAGHSTVPGIVEDGERSGSSLAVRRLLENCGQADIPPLELADAIEAVMASEGKSAREVAERIGLHESHISKLRALRKQLSPDLQQAVAEGKLGLKDAYELTTNKREHVSAERLARKVRAAERAARNPRQKVTLSIAKGCSIAVVGTDLSLDALAAWLAALAERAQAAREQGTSLEGFAASLRAAKTKRTEVTP